MNIQKQSSNRRLANSIHFSSGIFSLICGISLILLIFYQFIRNFFLNQGPSSDNYQIMISAYHPKLFYPEIFIPEGITLLILGLVSLFLLRWQLKKGYKSKNIDVFLIILTICIFIFVGIFVTDHVIAHHYLGRYTVFGSLFRSILLLIVIIPVIYITLFVKKFLSNKDKYSKVNDEPPKRLLDDNNLDYRVITVIFIAIIFIFFLMMPVLSANVPWTSHQVYWEDERLPTKAVLPGMNASYNLVFENEQGPLTFTYSIIETNHKGNWSVSSKKITVKPNEKKIITFTNYIPSNATEDTYYFDFWLVELIDEGPKSSEGPERIWTEVTLDMDYYNASQSTSSSFLSYLSGGSCPSTFYVYVIGPITFGSFIAWMMINIIYIKNKKDS